MLQQSNIGVGTLNRSITYIIETFNFELVDDWISPANKKYFFDPYKNGFLDWMELAKEELPERDFSICLERWGISSNQKSLEEIGIKYGLTQESDKSSSDLLLE